MGHFIPCPHSYLHFDLLSKISGGPWGGPWTGSTEVVYGPGPQGWSMDPGPYFVYIHQMELSLTTLGLHSQKFRTRMPNEYGDFKLMAAASEKEGNV